MARKNGSGTVEGLLEKILGELQLMNRRVHRLSTRVRGTEREIRALREEIVPRLDRLDARSELTVLGYQDLRERVTKLEK